MPSGAQDALFVAVTLVAAICADWYFSPYQVCLRSQIEMWERETLPNAEQIAREWCEQHFGSFRRWSSVVTQ